MLYTDPLYISDVDCSVVQLLVKGQWWVICDCRSSCQIDRQSVLPYHCCSVVGTVLFYILGHVCGHCTLAAVWSANATLAFDILNDVSEYIYGRVNYALLSSQLHFHCSLLSCALCQGSKIVGFVHEH